MREINFEVIESLAGVYCIRNKTNQKVYVGSSKQLKHRLENHKSSLRTGTHHSAALQRAWDKYGEDAFEFDLLEAAGAEELATREQHYIDTLGGHYNASRTAYRVEHTEEMRRKMSEKCRAAWQRPEHRAKMAKRPPPPKPPKEFYQTEEHRAKLREVHRAKHRTISAFGGLWSPKELAEKYEVKYTLLKDRLRAGWEPEKAVLTPKGNTGPKT